MNLKTKKTSAICVCLFILVAVISCFYIISIKSKPVAANSDNIIENQEKNEFSNETFNEESLQNEVENNLIPAQKENPTNESKNTISQNESQTNTNKNTNSQSGNQTNTNKNTTSQSKPQTDTNKNTASQDKNSSSEKKEPSSNSPSENNTGTTPYYIKVNYGAQVVTIYKKDNSGNYTVPVKAMVCSTGTSTPKSGVYKIPGRWHWGGLQGGIYGQYITVITGQILFHSVPYTERYNPGSLQYEEYDKLGTAASAGCIRLTVADALWIWNNCENGTQVEFYSSSNPGPLGKPSAKKISNAGEELRNWDPTDPDSSNPWKNPSKNDSSKKETSSQADE